MRGVLVGSDEGVGLKLDNSADVLDDLFAVNALLKLTTFQTSRRDSSNHILQVFVSPDPGSTQMNSMCYLHAFQLRTGLLRIGLLLLSCRQHLRSENLPMHSQNFSLPLAFEVNHGQTAADFSYVARTADAVVWLKSAEARLSWRRRKEDTAAVELKTQHTSLSWSSLSPEAADVTVTLVGANKGANPSPEQELPGKVSCLIGNNPATWAFALPTFGAVRFRNVYPGIDWLCYGNHQQFEYDFIVAPGADPKQIILQLDGATGVRVDSNGDLVISTVRAEIRQHRPTITQDIAGKKRPISGEYFLINAHQVGFRLSSYDSSLPLVIDPTLVYSTYFGSTNQVADLGRGIGLDSAGNIIVVGQTFAVESGVTFVAKLNPTGSQVLHSFLIGGTSGNQTLGVAVNPDGSACVLGLTSSDDFPVTQNAFQSNLKNDTDYFVAKINAAWTGLDFSTYLGSVASSFGPAPDTGGVAMDPQGTVYVVGSTSATDFPVTPGAFQKTLRNDFHDSFLRTDAFVLKLNANGTLGYSTYLGGNGTDRGNSITVDNQGSAYVTGSTLSSDFPLKNPIYRDAQSTTAFVAKLSPNGSDLVYSTLIAGASNGRGIALDAAQNAYLTGVAAGHGLPTTVSSFQSQPSNNGSQDAFLLKLNALGTDIPFATYLGGNGTDQGLAVAADPAGNVAVTGFTGFTGTTRFFPTTNSLQAYAGNLDAFVAKFDSNGDVIYSTYLGGSLNDVGVGIALDKSGNAWVIGETESSNFPIVSPFRGDFRGQDAFIAKISDAMSTTSSPPKLKLFNSFGVNSNGNFDMKILTVPLLHYRLESSTDLRTWELLTLFEADIDGTFRYQDFFDQTSLEQFYRVILNTNFPGGGKM